MTAPGEDSAADTSATGPTSPAPAGVVDAPDQPGPAALFVPGQPPGPQVLPGPALMSGERPGSGSKKRRRN